MTGKRRPVFIDACPLQYLGIDFKNYGRAVGKMFVRLSAKWLRTGHCLLWTGKGGLSASEHTQVSDSEFGRGSALPLHGVGEYWLIDAQAQSVEQYCLAKGTYVPVPRSPAAELQSLIVKG